MDVCSIRRKLPLTIKHKGTENYKFTDSICIKLTLVELKRAFDVINQALSILEYSNVLFIVLLNTCVTNLLKFQLIIYKKTEHCKRFLLVHCYVL